MNVLSADGIGRFPDQNVAASISRLPGIAVERDQGQERLVSVRGTPNRWTSLALNGTNVITSTAGGSFGERAPRFDTIPNAIVSRIEVYKAITPDMPSESIAGRVNIISRSAFDQEGTFASFDAGFGITDLEDNQQYDLKGAFSTTFGDNDQFGIVLSGSYYERDQRTDNIENRYRPQCRAGLDTAPGCEDRIFARRHEYRTYDLVRENTSGAVRFEYQPNDDHYFYANAIYTEFVDDEVLYRASVRLDRGPGREGGLAANGNTPFVGSVPGARLRPTFFITPRGEENVWFGIGGEHALEKEWNVDWSFSMADTSSFDRPSSYWWEIRGIDIDYDFNNADLPSVRLTNSATGNPLTAEETNGANFLFAEDLITENDTEAVDFHLDLEKEIVEDVTIKAGISYITRDQNNFRQGELTDGAALAAANIDVGLGRFMTNETLGGFPRDFELNAPNYNEMLAFREQFTSTPGLANAYTTGSNANAVRGYDVEEEILSGYVMGTMEAPWGSVVGGVRIEQADSTANANSFFTDAAGVTTVVPVTFSQSETYVLPSVYANWELNDESKLRLSVSKGLARPSFAVLSGRFSINDADTTISGGNPDLDAEEVLSFELNYEWYFDDDLGLFSAAVFHKDIANPFFGDSRTFASDILNSDGIDRSGYTLSTVLNGDSGSLTGVEFNFYKKLESGFGFSGNLTLSSGELTTPDGRQIDLPNSSDTVGNASVFYENYSWSARLNYQYRSDWLDNVEGENFDRFWDAEGRVSAQVQYAFNDNITLYFEGNNLTDEDGVRYQGFRNRVYEREQFGRRFLVGFRSTFGQ